MANPVYGGPGIGLSFGGADDFRMIHTSGCTKGDVAAVTTTTVNADTGVYDTVDTPAGTDGVFLIAMDTVAAGKRGDFRLRGSVKALATGAALGDALGASAGPTLAAPAAGSKVIAYATEADPGGGALTSVYFDGWSGIGDG